MRIKTTTCVLALTLAATGVSLTGCARTSLHSLRSDPSPENFNRTQSWDGYLNDQYLYLDVMNRSFWSDLQREWLTDHPSRSNPGPDPY